MPITNERNPMTLAQLNAICPSAFTRVAAPNVSTNYTHIPTSQVIEDMIELGWTPVSAQEVKSRKSAGFQKHITIIKNKNININWVNNDNLINELLLKNSN
jgi:hypothetical protein